MMTYDDSTNKELIHIVIRADASKTIGFGHFIRSLALAEYLKQEFKCFFCTFNPIELIPSEYQLKEISKVAQYVHIDGETYEEYDTKFLDFLQGDEIVVLDNYYFSTEYQNAIRKKGCRLVCIGPVKGQHYVADAIITSGHRPRSYFSFEPYSKYLNGLDHSFLRAPFLEAEKYNRRNLEAIGIALCIGGADPFRLTNKLIQYILEASSKSKVFVIAGDTVELENFYDKEVTVCRRLNAEEIVSIFSKVDIGIFSASTICIEALACKLPVAAGWYVDNQKDFYDFGVREGYFIPLGNFLDNDTLLKNNINHILNSSILNSSKNIDFLKGKEDIIRVFKNL